MIKSFSKIVIPIIFWSLFLYVVFNVPYPKSITEANFLQLMTFFTFLFLSLTVTFNLFLKNIFLSFLISIGIIFLLILKALDALNLVTVIITLLVILLLRSGLTSKSKLPKLTKWRKKRQ